MDKSLAIIIAVLIPVIITVVFIKLIRKRNELLEIELNQEVIDSFIGGGRFVDGLVTTKLSYPFVQVRLYKDFMVISYFKKLVFKYTEINVKQTLRGLQVIHRNRSYPDKVYLSLFDNEQLVDFIRNHNNDRISLPT
ncbi:hypothetical protein [Paenibacillus rigui]|uniref:Uncharacterized protein n=1 Tax=Paenibacillus rigui TaxID=554312 RepID=A0A229UGM9_9BACL|nr:hypothetical protein [Paenibacillus rigui]OXM82510.1 hypothetical protein CF651_30575 [Paenibacillus rigui]